MDDYRETLYTITKDGRRKWVYADIVGGFFRNRRRIVAYILLILYLMMPWITINGAQGVFLDITDRKFVVLGATFWATDTRFLFLLLGGLVFCLFFFTSVFGRIWCGWACPETVFLEFLFRPLETLIEGGPVKRKRLDAAPWNLEKIIRKCLKHLICGACSWFLATTLLAYFLGRGRLIGMITGSPFENPSMFLLTLAMMGLMFFQFGWFREQFCTVVCPYARLQSVLLDSDSLLVGYDRSRGEPRGKVSKKSSENLGDCVDCGLCVRVCPTGIDIRNGLQMECIQCAACADACNSIMAQVGRAPNLIGYNTENGLDGKYTGIFRPRVLVYGSILLIYVAAFAYFLSYRTLTEFHLIRSGGHEPFSMINDDVVSNHLNLHISNKDSQSHRYILNIEGEPAVQVITALSPIEVRGGSDTLTPVFFNFPKQLLVGGKRLVSASLTDEANSHFNEALMLVGPE